MPSFAANGLLTPAPSTPPEDMTTFTFSQNGLLAMSTTNEMEGMAFGFALALACGTVDVCSFRLSERMCRNRERARNRYDLYCPTTLIYYPFSEHASRLSFKPTGLLIESASTEGSLFPIFLLVIQLKRS